MTSSPHEQRVSALVLVTGICSSYPAVANGAATPSSQVFVDDMVAIVCNEGYQINDAANSPATCMESGSGGAVPAAEVVVIVVGSGSIARVLAVEFTAAVVVPLLVLVC